MCSSDLEELAACALDPWDAAHHPEFDPALAIAAARAAEREPPFDPPEIPGDSPVARAASALFRGPVRGWSKTYAKRRGLAGGGAAA